MNVTRALARSSAEKSHSGVKMQGRRILLRASHLVASVVIALVACSSSSSSSASAVDCEIPDPAQELGSCKCTSGGGSSNGTACSAVSLSGADTDAVCLYSASTKECSCLSFYCFSATCYYAPVKPSTPHAASCSGAHYCLGPTACECGDSPCGSNEEELTSCSDDTAKAKLKAIKLQLDHMVFPGDVIVDDCRAALENGSAGDDTGDSDAGTGTDTSTSGPKCKSAGPGLCADTPALNHCNCGAGCYRDSADVGSGFSCHVACKTDADCDNFYSFATTCQPFTADGVQAMECR